MEKGDILWAKDCENHPHPIVFIEEIDNVRFKSCILSSDGVSVNELMEPKHFCIYDNEGKKYSFQYANTHLVKDQIFIKMRYWVYNKVAGRLTTEGLLFIEDKIPKELDPILCTVSIKDYKNNSR